MNKLTPSQQTIIQMQDSKISKLAVRTYQVTPDTTADLCEHCRLTVLPRPCTKAHLTHAEYVDLVGAHDG